MSLEPSEAPGINVTNDTGRELKGVLNRLDQAQTSGLARFKDARSLAEITSPKEKTKALSFNEACVLYEQAHSLRIGSDANRSWSDIQGDFRYDPNIGQMNKWELGSLEEDEFWNLVFCEMPNNTEVYQGDKSRRLIDVATRAKNTSFTDPYFKDVKRSLVPPNVQSAPFMEPIIIRDSLGEELLHGSQYIHDGNRRLLRYAVHLLEKGGHYVPLPAIRGTRNIGETDTSREVNKGTLKVEGFKGRKSIPTTEMSDTFNKAEQLYFVLPDKIGDSVFAFGYIRAVLEMEKVLGLPPKEKILMAPINIHPMFKYTCEKLGIKLCQAPQATGVNRAECQARDVDKKKAVVFEMDALGGGGGPEGLYFGHGQMTLRNLLPSMLERYRVDEVGLNRQRYYLRDMFGVNCENIDPRDCQPGIELPNDHELRKKQLIVKYQIDTQKPQVAISIETSEVGRQYSLEKWAEVIKLMKKQFPNAEFNVIFDPKKNVLDETYLDRDQMKELFTKAASEGDNGNVVRFMADPLLDILSFLPSQNTFIGCDTGIMHLAASTVQNGLPLLEMPNVIVLFATPQADPQQWLSSKRMKAVTPPTDDAQDVTRGIYCPDPNRKWINQINAEDVANCALAHWK